MGRVHDLRLAPAAAASWGVAWWATGSGVGPVRHAGLAVLVAAGLATVVMGGLVLHERRRAGRARADGLSGGRRLLATSVLVGACVGVVLCVTAVHLQRWSAPAVQAVADRQGSVAVELVVTGDPTRGTGSEAWQQEQVRLRVDLVQVTTPTGGPVRVEVPALLRADASWAGARWGERRGAVLRLRPAPAGEPYAVLASVTGPSTVLTTPRWHWRAAERLRDGLVLAATEGTEGPTTDGAALLPGLVVGDTRLQDADLVQDLRTAGLSHLSAVSGANVTLVCGAVLLLVVLLRGGRRAGAAAAAVALVALVVVARPEPSVLRAAVMGSVGLLGVVVGRRGGGTSALCLAVVVVLLLDPWLSRAAGFRLSVIATAALAVCALPWSRALGRVLPRPAALALAVPAAAQAAVTPALVGLEPVLSLYALPANVLAAPAVPPATVLGLVAALLSLLDARLAALVALPARWCAAWIAGVGRTAADLPGAAVPVPQGLPGALLVGGGTAVLLLLAVLVLRALPDRRRAGQTWAPWCPTRPAPSADRSDPARGSPARGPVPPARVPERDRVVAGAVGATPWSKPVRFPVLVVLLVPVLVLAPVLLARTGVLPRGDPWPGAGWDVVVCDVGQGESVLVRAGPSSAVVVDTGPEPAPVEACLRRAGVTSVPLLLLTHLHADHVGGLDGVSAVAPVGRVWTAPGGMPPAVEADLVRWAAEHGAVLDRPVAGAGVVLGPTRVDVLASGTAGHPEGDAQDVNDAGLVVRLDTGSLVLLAVGDVGADVQGAILGSVGPGRLRADVTTVAHHGSADQLPAFYAAVGARVAVASAGRDNSYGHPTDRARDVVTASGARVLATATDGDVALRAAGAPGGPGPAGGSGPAGGLGDAGGVVVGVRTTRKGRCGWVRRDPTRPGRPCPRAVPA